MPRAFGVDVSHHRPVIDWNALSASASFVGVKATEGNTVTDPKLREHREGLRTQPFALAIYYHFARPGSPVKQAERLMDVVGALRDNERLALDLEVLPADAPDVITWVESFLSELAGFQPERRPLLYTSDRIWRQFGGPTVWEPAEKIDLWVPRYSDQEPIVPAPWSRWTFWQFSETEIVSGVAGPCDGNYFTGDEDELHEYARLGSAVA